MTQGFLLGLGIFGGLIVGGLLVSIGGLILSNIVEIAKVVGIFVGIAVVSYLGFAGCAVVLAAGALLVLIGWSAAKAAIAVKRRPLAR
jgi:hypothetical protein